MRSLNLDQLRAFVELMERGSFTAAAKELNLSQPAVTHQVQELERRFKVPLVDRLGKRACATHAGEKLLEHARSLLDEDMRVHSAMRRFADGSLGRVRIGTSMTVLIYLLPRILRQLKSVHPHLEINLKAGLTAATLDMFAAMRSISGYARCRSTMQPSMSGRCSRTSSSRFCRPRSETFPRV